MLSSYDLTTGKEAYPDPVEQTGDEILHAIRETVAPVLHAAATCKMRKENDAMVVIESSARAFGVKGLRVVAASSFPFLPPRLPQSYVYFQPDSYDYLFVGLEACLASCCCKDVP